MSALHPLQTSGRRAAPARMEPLAKLPVFFDLSDKKVVLAGGSEGAAWKAELLLACGAWIDLYCPSDELSETFRNILSEDAARDVPRVTHYDRPWSISCFDYATIALGDCETDEEAKAFYCAAKAARVPVNVIDKPAFCEFQFGSIVNRSPVIISISTDGAAPILGQAIRRRIETLLPPTLKNWAEIAQSIRAAINERLSPGTERRTFWERFVDRVFREAPAENMSETLIQEAEAIALSSDQEAGTGTGKVTLVGAGPGDAELLTLKAVRALQSADVILFDDLVSADVLELARREAKRMLVGKRGGRESCKQEDINATMVALAKAGKRVVRLKSGDPMIFGRAGEEIESLERENIPVEIVPGITSATAMAARLGVSLTHRDHAQSVRFVTGHSRKGELPTDLDWSKLADSSVTTIFYMGGRTAAAITDKLTGYGMSPSTPAVILSSIARDDEKRWVGELCGMPQAMREIGYHNPVLIGIGDAFIKAKRIDVQPVQDVDLAESGVRQG